MDSINFPHFPEVSWASLLPGDETGRQKGWGSLVTSAVLEIVLITGAPKGLLVKGRASCRLNPKRVAAAPHLAKPSPFGLPAAPCRSLVSSPGPGRHTAVGFVGAQPECGAALLSQVHCLKSTVFIIIYFKCPNQVMTPDNQAEMISLLSQVKVSWTEARLASSSQASPE